jgi:transmembrane sensor
MSYFPTMTATGEHDDDDETLRRQAKDWLVHIATGSATKDELKALDDWRAESPKHAEAFTRASDLWHALGAPLEAVEQARRPQGMARFAATGRLVGRRGFLGGALAASAAAAAGIIVVRPPFDLWPSFNELTAEYRTGTGEQRRLVVGDQSSVELNTRTSINVRTSADADSIELIAGEAALAVGAKNFAVLAAQGQTSATQAQFIVRCDDGQARVTCLSGAVNVAARGSAVTVRSGWQVAYDGAQGLGPVIQVDPEIAAGWRDGLLVFDNEPLKRVIEEVNRYRSGRIILMNSELGERRVTARFKIARLDAVLTQFQAAFGAKVTPLPGGFVLLG